MVFRWLPDRTHQKLWYWFFVVCWGIFVFMVMFDALYYVAKREPVDFMPLSAGIMFLLLAPKGLILQRSMPDVLVLMNETNIVLFRGDEERTKVAADYRRMTLRYGWGGALVIAVSLIVSTLIFHKVHFEAGVLRFGDNMSLFFFWLLILIQVVVGAAAGLFLGRFLGNGQLGTFLKNRRYELHLPIARDNPLRAFVALRSLYTFACVTCLVMFVWFGAWIVLLSAGANLTWIGDYVGWRNSFIWLWMVATAIFVAGVVWPIYAWDRRIRALRAQARASGLLNNPLHRQRVPRRWLGGGILDGRLLAGLGALDIAALGLSLIVN